MAKTNNHIREQAIDWVIRISAPQFDAWDDFIAWLETNPRHNDVYEQVAAANHYYDCLAQDSQTMENPPLAACDWTSTTGIAKQFYSLHHRLKPALIIASLCVLVGCGFGLIHYDFFNPRFYQITTARGDKKNVILSDGSKILLNGNSKIQLSHGKPRYVRLDHGEALFTLVHHDVTPFIVDIGDSRLIDVGTKFNVVHNAGRIDVSVAEGAVVFNPRRQNLELTAGRRLIRYGPEKLITISPIKVAEVASWQDNQLIFKQASLSEVTAALDRNLKIPVKVSDAVASRTFSGAVHLQDKDEETIETIATLAGVAIQKRDGVWVLAEDH